VEGPQKRSRRSTKLHLELLLRWSSSYALDILSGLKARRFRLGGLRRRYDDFAEQ